MHGAHALCDDHNQPLAVYKIPNLEDIATEDTINPRIPASVDEIKETGL
jgi:hypothetical protein